MKGLFLISLLGWILSEPRQTEGSGPSVAPVHVFLLFARVISTLTCLFLLRHLLVEYRPSQFSSAHFSPFVFLLNIFKEFFNFFFGMSTKSLILTILF